MPATELSSVSNLEVQGMTWSPGQARTLTAFHAVKVGSPSQLANGTVVQYTDDDLGLCFYGKIVDIKRAWKNKQEGVTYSCADAYRTLSKQAAMIDVSGGSTKTTRISLAPGSSMNDAIDAIIDGSRLATVLPGGLDNDLDDVELPMIDKGGQSVDTWLNDLLGKTDGGVAWVDPNGGSPKLFVRDYYSQPTVDLTVGDYNVVSPADGELLLESADEGESLNRKYQRVTVEGCGQYTRHEMVFLSPVITQLGPYLWQHKFYLPDTPPKRAVCKYLDDDGKCRELCFARIQFGRAPDELWLSSPVMDIHNIQFQTEEDGRVFWELRYQVTGFFGGTFQPHVPPVKAWLSYTTWDGGLLATRTSSNPLLAGEGELIEQHEEFVKYTGPHLSVDNTSEMQAIADSLAVKFSTDPDRTGQVRVHIKGINADLKIGSGISNFDGARVQSISYDFPQRSMALQVSNIPIREKIQVAKQNAMVRSTQGNNWFTNKVIEVDTCFCAGGAVAVNSSGNPTGGGTNPDKDKGQASWDCNRNTFECEERNDGRGQYRSLQECRDNCKSGGVKFVDCVGCLKTAGQAQYDSMEECDQDHPEGSEKFYEGCFYDCMPDGSCISGVIGDYDDVETCKSNCTTGGSGSSGGSGVEPPDPPVSHDPSESGGASSGGTGGESGDSAEVTVLKNATCDNDTGEIVKEYVTLKVLKVY